LEINRASSLGDDVRRGRATDGRTKVRLRKVPPPLGRWVGKSDRARARARAQKRHSLRPRMIRAAMTFLEDLVKRRLPTGASPNSRDERPATGG